MRTKQVFARAAHVRPHLRGDPPDHQRESIPGTDAVRGLWSRFHLAGGAKPIVGALIVGAITVALAAELGVAELAFGAGATYASYRMLRYGIDLKEAFTETVRLEKAVVNP